MAQGLGAWGKGRLWGEWRNPATGNLVPGNITIKLLNRLTNLIDDAIVPAGVVVNKQQLVIIEDEATANGVSFDMQVFATNDPDIEQAGWGYQVTVELTGFATETYSGVQVPVGGETNLRTLIPTTSTPTPTAASLNLGIFPRLLNGVLVDGNGDPISTGGGGGSGDLTAELNAFNAEMGA